jgi:hypothetical protein
MRLQFTLFFLFSSFALTAQTTGDYPPNAQPGKCYAKCLVGDKYITEDQEFPEFVGADSTGVFFETVTLVVLKNGKPQKLELKIVDTTSTDAYEMLVLPVVVSKEEGGYTEWKEVLCGQKVSVNVVSQIQRALRSRGFDPGPDDGVINVRTKAALVQFQKANGLPEGALDFETLRALGITY